MSLGGTVIVICFKHILKVLLILLYQACIECCFSTRGRNCVITIHILYLHEMSHCELERDVVFCELPCQRALFKEQEKL